MPWIAILLVACGGSAPKPPTADEIALCDSLDRNTCLASNKCTLVHVADTQYACRPEQGACERGHRQDDKAGCEQRSGCQFEPATCYCECKGYGRTKAEDSTGEPCKCFCGGGAPSTCVSKTAPPEEAA